VRGWRTANRPACGCGLGQQLAAACGANGWAGAPLASSPAGSSRSIVVLWPRIFAIRRAQTRFLRSKRTRARCTHLSVSSSKNISVHVPAVLRDCCGGATELHLPASSVRDALREIERRHPSLYRSICDETSQVRRHINVFVNVTHVRDRQGLDTLLEPGDVVTILPAVSGG
jgi:molybdopterin synthase sulfur carrier subunit